MGVCFVLLEKRGPCQLRTVLRDVGLAEDIVTCSSASYGPGVEELFDVTLNDWSQRRNVGKFRMLLEFRSASLRLAAWRLLLG